MSRLPAIELLDILEPAYAPCAAFRGACAGTAIWAPARGHVPRGFLGAAGRIEDVRLVLLVAEPGDPHGGSHLDPELDPRGIIARAVDDTYRCFRDGADLFHRNMRLILDLAFPDLAFDDQLRHVWISNTYLCSAPRETGHVPNAATSACGEAYLKAQLELLSNCPVIALGRKARDRAKRLRRSIPNLPDRLFHGYAASPPGCNRRPACRSWREAVDSARSYLQPPRDSAPLG